MLKKPTLYDTIDVKRTFEAGGYVMKIVDAIYVPSKDYIELHLDVAEGPFTNYFATKVFDDKWNRNAIKYLSLKDTKGAVSMLKGAITAIENSNNFKFDWESEKKLIGKKVGAVFGKVQYRANDGTLKFNVRIDSLRSIESIVQGNFEIPEPKYLDLGETGSSDYLESMRALASFNESERANNFNISDDDLPF